MTIARRIIRIISDLIDKALLIFFILIFLIGGYALLDTYLLYLDATDESLLKYKPEYTGSEEDVAPIEDMVAWITIDGTQIDYPVMQGVTNDEYINKNPYGEYSLSGSIFLDSRNKADFSDTYNMIYGHHMEYGAMFGALDQYSDEDYFEQHKTGKLIVKDKTYRIDFFAFLIASAEEEAVFEIDDAEASIRYFQQNHLIYKEPVNRHMIALSTCKTPESIERTILVGCLTEEREQDHAENQ